MSIPNPKTPIPSNQDLSASTPTNVGSSASTISRPSSSTVAVNTSSTNLDRFLQQAEHDDGTLHGRTANATYHPLPTTYILSYEARAAAAIAACDAVLSRDFSCAPFPIGKYQESTANQAPLLRQGPAQSRKLHSERQCGINSPATCKGTQ